MQSFIRKLFRSKQKAKAEDKNNVTAKTIDDMMQQIGINPKFERFKTEAYHLTTLITQQKLTVTEALATVQDASLREELRPLIYAVFLSSLVMGVEYMDVITHQQAQDLTAYLGKPWS